jgi:hypothetical protein
MVTRLSVTSQVFYVQFLSEAAKAEAAVKQINQVLMVWPNAETCHDLR